MSKNLINLLKKMVTIVQHHGDRIALLEQGELEEDSGDMSLMEEVTSLLDELQTPESGFAIESIPSDQV